MMKLIFNSLTEEIKIFDITGRKIRSVSAGTGKWDGKDDGGTIVESGVYIYQFTVDGTFSQRRYRRGEVGG